MTAIGWFDDYSDIPAHDPGLDVPCPVCAEPLHQSERVMISFLFEGAECSYFFRAHRSCWRPLTDAQQIAIESTLVDALAPQQ